MLLWRGDACALPSDNKLASLTGLSDQGLPRLARLEARGNGPLKSLSTIGSLTALRELIVVCATLRSVR